MHVVVITRYNDNMDITVRRIGNSLGVIVPRSTLDQWGVGEGDRLEVTANGIRPKRGRRNAQELLDELKRSIALEVVRRHPPEEIRQHSRNNLKRWRAAGVWSKAYEEWRRIVEGSDDGELLKAMVGLDERANRLRQSMPYAGMLPREITRRLNEEAARCTVVKPICKRK
jgi:antitoxin component of MazEF toxin-antitoxin module